MAGIDSDGNKNFTLGIMNKNCWLLMGLMVAASAVAQDTNTPAPGAPSPIVIPAPAAPAAAPATNAPVKLKKKKAHKKAAAAPRIKLAEPAVTLTAGTAEVAADIVNVRGQAGLKGEFITHLSKGDAVTVLSQINLDKHQADEPAQWAKIAFPASAHVWVSTAFIDATNKTVSARKLNLRAGPSEMYSVVGEVERGTPVNPVSVKGDWTEIDPPASAYAFIAAMYLKQEASGNLAANPPASTETAPVPAPDTNAAPATTTVAEAQPEAAAPTNPPTPVPVPITDATPPADIATNPPAPAAPDTNTVAATNAPAPAVTDTNAAPGADTNAAPAAPRIVTHEGVVRHVISVIEPTEYELYDPATGAAVDYLYSTSTNLDVAKYKGLRIDVTGEERLAERWPNTPVLTIQNIQVVK
jgi:uncharacterized protein YgiM (DUF1202 family)